MIHQSVTEWVMPRALGVDEYPDNFLRCRFSLEVNVLSRPRENSKCVVWNGLEQGLQNAPTSHKLSDQNPHCKCQLQAVPWVTFSDRKGVIKGHSWCWLYSVYRHFYSGGYDHSHRMRIHTVLHMFNYAYIYIVLFLLLYIYTCIILYMLQVCILCMYIMYVYYVCILCMYIMYVCMYLCIYVCIHVYIYVFIHVYIHVYIHVLYYVHIDIYIYYNL